MKWSLHAADLGDTAPMARILGALYLSGAFVVALSLLMPHPEDADDTALATIAVAAALAGAAAITRAELARLWMVHSMLAIGTGLITLCVYFSGVADGVYSAMYVWAVLMAASFFRTGAVWAHVAWVLTAWAVVLTLVESSSGFSPASRWLLAAVVLIVSAGVVNRIVTGRRDTEAVLRREVTEKARLQDELEHLAHHDPLTGLANRRRFEDSLNRELARARRHRSPLCLMVIDLDEFKDYNDTYGHAAGDRLLCASIEAWTPLLRAEDLLARIGGDEFVVVLPDCPPEKAVEVRQRLYEETPAGRTCSAGIAHWDGEESADDLFARADRNLYGLKARAAYGRSVPA